jgi:sugar phosphate permease
MASFFFIAIFCQGFGNIVAFCIQKMHGLADLNGWQWIFVIEGIFTVLLGILAYLYVPDFPDRNRFLTPEQTAVSLLSSFLPGEQPG